MNLIRLIGLYLALFTHTACDLIDNRHPSTKAAHKVIREFKEEMQKKYSLKAVSISEAGTKEVYTRMGIGFEINRTLSKDQGRALLVKCLEAFIDKINSSKELEEYLDPYPFSYDQISMSIIPVGVDRLGVITPEIGIFQYGSGQIWYYKLTEENSYPISEEQNETYEEAFEKAQEYLKTHDLQAELK
ncbi:MAG: hypothetical protein WD595_05525 [Waddliaceae bacterium]